jgi:hypothetical protein
VKIVDGNHNESVVLFRNEETLSSIFDGFTVTNGKGGGSFPNYTGGGISCINNSSPSITNNIIYGNTTNCGGGILCYNSSPIIEKNIIDNNNASGIDGDGGGGYGFVTVHAI